MTPSRRLGWALLIGVVAALVAVAGGAERWLAPGRPGRLTFEVQTPTPVTGATDDPVAQAWRVRLPGRSMVIAPAADPRQVTVTVDGTVPDADWIGPRLDRAGRLVFTVVANDAPVMRRWYERVRAGEIDAEVQAEGDAWNNERTGEASSDYYLRARDRAELELAIKLLTIGDPLPDGLAVVYELVELQESSRDPRFFRTYLVEATPSLDGHDVASASVTFDQNTLRPEVTIRFTTEGAQRFGDTTGGMVGRKLAMVVDGAVVSAPIIQTRIAGGVASITMGGNDPRRAEHDAGNLVAALRPMAELPEGIRATLGQARPGEAGLPWLAPLLLGLIGAALAFVGTARLTPWLAPAPRHARGSGGLRGTVGAAVLTVGLPLALIVLPDLMELWLPGVNALEMARIVSYGARSGWDEAMARVGVFALGVLPVISAFWLVEAYAALAPRWRRRRLGVVGDRLGLDLAVLVTGFALAALQALFIAQYLDRLSGVGTEIFVGTTKAYALLIVTAVAGVAVHVVVANLISRHGLCNGYLALLGMSTARTLYLLLDTPPAQGQADHRTIVLASLLVIAAVTVLVTGLRSRGPDRARQPWPALVAAVVLGELIGLAILVMTTFLAVARQPLDLRWLFDLNTRPLWFDAMFVVTALALIVRWLRLPVTRLAVASAAVVLATIFALRGLSSTLTLSWILPSVYLAFFAVELATSFRARLGLRSPTIVLAVHDVERADRAADALTAAGIAASVEGVRARAMLRGLAAYLPIVIRVAAEDVERAIAVVADAEADRDPSVAAFAA